MITIETSRLLLRNYRVTDFEDIIKYFVISLNGADELQIARIMAAQLISFTFVLAIYVYRSRKKRVNRNVFN